MTAARRSREDIMAQLLRKPTLRNCVDANCVSCIYDELAPGSWRMQVEGCMVNLCPLHDVRPKSRSAGHAKENGVRRQIGVLPMDTRVDGHASKDVADAG